MLLIICYITANAIGFGIFPSFFTYALSRVVAKNLAFFLNVDKYTNLISVNKQPKLK